MGRCRYPRSSTELEKLDGVFQEPEAVEIDEYQSDDDDDDFRAEVDFDVDIRGADDI